MRIAFLFCHNDPLLRARFPFRILQASIDLELQDFDLDDENNSVRPQLCVSDCAATPDQGMVRAKPSRLPTKLTRRKRWHIPLMSTKLAFVRELPTVEVRWAKK